ncbi:aegerolysin domain-containing protein [Hirsutella rhossiliensis]|uniref:Aegerolysin domain-containing protein n=1 Tax=Hirsutella rhossiliensis TaxID=111463 RepID=A0A9P8N701_9HYPO|nr:aegerolysin domain-containing protein [Hirsutella rhossiliensis]KAH0967914.1 aegerolysin domain-containing protein [Hirsutella rhossiliensis]
MAYAQWLTIQIQNLLKKNDIRVQHAVLEWGKFYKTSKDVEVTTSQIEAVVIAPGSSESVSACGRSDASSGTTGQFDIYEGAAKICTVKWDCPWGSKTNSFNIESYNIITSPYLVSVGNWNRDSGAIGTVPIVISQK